MKKTLHPILIAFILCMTSTLFAQNQMEVLLRTGATVFPENAREYAATATISNHEMVEGHYYRLLQFHQLPNNSELAAIQAAGIELLEYIPYHTYVASLPTDFPIDQLEDLGVRSIQELNLDLKLDDQLRSADLPKWATAPGDQVLAMLKFHKNLDFDHVLAYCKADGIKVIRSNGHNNFLRTSIAADKLMDVAALPYVAFVEMVPSPDIKDDILGRSLHRSNVINTESANGRKYTGEGVSVLCRDDGDVGPHIDFHGRIDNTDANPGSGTHADGVSGIMAGAGNLNPRFKGMADHSFLFVIDYVADFLDETMDLHFDENVLVTNSSYSNGCNAGYTQIAETVDQQLYNNPTLMHVFSAGNSNNSDCGYGAGNQWGNITGGHKQGKNCITTANLNDDASIRNSSSRGPAHDGRIKPDIAAHGAGQISTDPNNEYQSFGGTSAAAPGIAGITAQLHQAYQDLNGGETAEAPLLKAIMLNTANDLGNKGPDFIFGWGHINSYRSVLTLEEERYFKTEVAPMEENMHTVTIPDGVVQARVMVYWADQEGTVFTNKALVNNLDAWMTDGNGTQHLPWLLDHTPDPALLNTAAAKGVDNLNNMEQIAIDNPEAGDYTLHVQGTELPFGNHSYYVVWEFRMDDITVTHPVGGEGFDPGEELRIHWDAMNTGTPFDISYSTDNGDTWNAINTVAPNAIMYSWTVPNEISGEVLVRVEKAGGASDSNDEVFSIAPRVENKVVTQACPDYLRLEWDPVDLGSASTETGYEVYVLGDRFMEPVGTTTETFFEVPITDLTADQWLAVKTLGDNGIESERTVALLYNDGLKECVLQVDLEITQVLAPGSGSAYICGGGDSHVTIELNNNGMEDLTDITVSYSLNGGPLVTENYPGVLAVGETAVYEFTEVIDLGGMSQHEIEIFSEAPGDMFAQNNIQSYTFSAFAFTGTPATTDYTEDFQSGVFPPMDYFVNNLDGADTWAPATGVTGSDGNATDAASVINYFYNTEGEMDELYVIPVSLVGVAEPTLSFDYAYAPYNDVWNDGLQVIIAECGGPFNDVIFDKAHLELSTVGGYLTNSFTPSSADQWVNESFDLSAYIGKEIVIKFVNINGYGNNMYLDNINVFSLTPPVAAFDVSTTTVCEGESITFTPNSQGANLTYEWNFGSGASPGTSGNSSPITVTYDEAGTITASLTVTNPAGSSTSTEMITVNPQPVPSFDYSTDGYTVNFNNLSQFCDSYTWNFGDSMGGSISESPSYTYTGPGTYTVSLSGTNGCGTIEFTFDVVLDPSSTNELAGRLNSLLRPNPSNGNFVVSIDNDRSETLQLQIIDVTGVIHDTQEVETAVGPTNVIFDRDDLATGVYLLKIIGEDGYKAMKLVIE